MKDKPTETIDITLNHEFKLYTNSYAHINKIIDICCEIWNHCIALHRKYYKIYHKHLNKSKLQQHITKLKGRTFQHWNKIPSQSIQDITDRIQRGYDRFFDYNKNKSKYPHPVRIPKFKKPHQYKSLTLKQAGWDLDQLKRKFRFQKKWYGYHQSKTFQGEIKTVTLKRLYPGIFAYFSTETKVEITKRVASPAIKFVGFDMSLSNNVFLVSSEGEHDDRKAPLFLQNIDKLHFLLEKFNKTQSQKTLKEYQKVHWKIKCQRDWFQWKLAHELTEQYDRVCFESPSFQNMDAHFQKRIQDYAPDLFIQKTKHLCKKKGKEFVERDRWFPSSKMCHDCGYVNKDLQLSDRTWTCPSCGQVHDRDRNAAKNIRDGGSTPAQYDSLSRSQEPITG